MKDAMLVALAEAQWIRSYIRLLMGRGMILGGPMPSFLFTGPAVPPCLGWQSGFHLFFVCVWKKAYMPIDANHVSNAKDR